MHDLRNETPSLNAYPPHHGAEMDAAAKHQAGAAGVVMAQLARQNLNRCGEEEELQQAFEGGGIVCKTGDKEEGVC